MPEPRDPLLKVLTIEWYSDDTNSGCGPLAGAGQLEPAALRRACQSNKGMINKGWEICPEAVLCNDPSAGSPTETLLRLLLPLNDQV
jgi:hypothetical protein